MSAESNNELAETFNNAAYFVCSPEGELRLRIGEMSPAMQRLLQDCMPPSAAIITAYNPNAQKQSDDANRAAQARLLARMHEQQMMWLTGHNCSPEGDGPVEPTALVLAITRTQAEQLGRDFEQVAIVYIAENATPQLLWL